MKKDQKPITPAYAWYALGLMFLINLTNYVDRLSIGPAMEHIKRYFDATDTMMGLILYAFTIVYAVVSVPMGIWSDRAKRTPFVAAGALVWSIATTISGFATGFWKFFAARAFVGSGEGIYQPTGTVLITDYFPRKQRATAISIFMSAMLVGGAIAIVVAGAILKSTDRLDMERVAELITIEQGAVYNGWKFDGLNETRKRKASFEFSNGADRLQVQLSIPNRKKETDAKTRLFDIDYILNENEEPAGTQLEFANSVTGLIRDNEDNNLESISSPLIHRPTSFDIPDKYRSLLRYDEAGKQLTYLGIMSIEDKKELRLISDDPKYQKAIVGIYNTANFYFRRSDNWKWIFWILGPPGLVFAFLALFLREPVKGGTEEFLDEKQKAVIEKKSKIDYSPLWKTRSLVIMIFSNVLATFAIGGLNTWLFPFVERYKDMEASEAALKIGPIVIVAMLAGVVISGIVADKLFRRTKYAYNIILATCILVAIPFFYIFFLNPNYYMMIAAVAFGLFCLSWINGPQNTMLMSVVEPRLRATMNAFHILLIHVLGDGPSPLIIGALSDRFSLKFAFMILPIFLVVAAIGFGIAGYYVPGDLKRLEQRMKKQAQQA
ncbi:MAG TPA: MFS transporter [bacterium]|nr:MFS transporter [bacterium]